MATRMWVFELDSRGDMTDHKFSVDNPAHIPRVGEVVEHDNAFGEVSLIHYIYRDETAEFSTIINVYLKYKG